MTEQELRCAFDTGFPQYEAWGGFVTSKIEEALAASGEAGVIRIPPKPRVKESSSFIEKALYRNKGYSDPIRDITDKVGTRFVVLLSNDIGKIETVIQENRSWEYSKDRDYEAEKEKNPALFGYQSVHYVLKNVRAVDYNGTCIEQGQTCEVQIRTLLQHAYSEVTHDTVYKPSTRTDSKMLRRIARSMALMEAADETFVQVFDEIEKMKNEEMQILTVFRRKYENICPSGYNAKLSSLLLTAFHESLKSISHDSLDAFLRENSFLEEKIQERCPHSLLFAQPVILGLYFLVENQPNKVKKTWPLTEPELQPLFNDLGKAMNH